MQYITLKILTSLVSSYGWVLSSTVVLFGAVNNSPVPHLTCTGHLGLRNFVLEIAQSATTQKNNGPSVS